MRPLISVENVWKQYRLGVAGSGMMSEDLRRWWAKVKGKEELFPDTIEKNDRSVKSGSSFVWALQDINFKVNQGEVLGLIGKNGAGKSTILKILSRVTAPTKGNVRLKGRIASLLEVGTGFHPELTGRENVFINGAVLGMTKSEIRAKFDEIIAFSGVERYIDTPVKRYSSGMYVRLAFAVAAHLEPEILIVDEVLAVGDAEFQKKCLGKMKDASGSGRTILFVSHNMTAMRSLCTRAILMEHGTLKMEGRTEEVIAAYMGQGSEESNGAKKFIEPLKAGNEILLHGIAAFQLNKDPKDVISIDAPVVVEIDVENSVGTSRKDFTLQFKDNEGHIIFATGTGTSDSFQLSPGRSVVRCHVPADLFNNGIISLNLLVVEDRANLLYRHDDILRIVYVEPAREIGRWMGSPPGPFRPKLIWDSGTKM